MVKQAPVSRLRRPYKISKKNVKEETFRICLMLKVVKERLCASEHRVGDRSFDKAFIRHGNSVQNGGCLDLQPWFQ
jgi:hypothetical protein